MSGCGTEPTSGAGTERHVWTTPSKQGRFGMCAAVRCGQICSTLMSAFPSSRRVNSWLCFKRVGQALPGKALAAIVASRALRLMNFNRRTNK
jgi:hypothetical protein